jgi:hypothetical protein
VFFQKKRLNLGETAKKLLEMLSAAGTKILC